MDNDTVIPNIYVYYIIYIIIYIIYNIYIYNIYNILCIFFWHGHTEAKSAAVIAGLIEFCWELPACEKRDPEIMYIYIYKG